jgi:superfamily II DNA or RNA helicase
MDTFLSDDKRFITIRECTQEEYEAVKTAYTKKAEGYRYNPLYKKKLWDGNVTYFKGANLPSGTWSYLIDISKQCGWKLKIDGLRGLFDNDITLESYTEWVDEFFADLPFTPRDYQIKSAYKILRFRKCLSELATSAGKTLICFMVLAYLIDKHIIKGKVLMIVPTVQLVLQSSGDFEEYNTDKLPLIIQQIYAGFKMKPDANIYVGTYQTLTKMDDAWFKQFDCVIVDETHKAKAKSIKDILERCWHCEYKFGVTGTLPKPNSAESLTLQTYLGPLVTEVKAKALQDEGYISNCKIVQMRIDYVSEKKKEEFANAYALLMRKKKGSDAFNLEKNFIIENEKRFAFISDLISKTTKNTLVLFHRIIYGKKLFAFLRANLSNKRVYYIDGSIDKDIRKEITDRMDKYDDVILVASFATLSTGVSVNHIYNVIFTESFKSPFVIIQSIGRSLRLKDKENKEKNKATIIDIVDDFRHGKYMNYLYRHGLERMRMYKEQQYPVILRRAKW